MVLRQKFLTVLATAMFALPQIAQADIVDSVVRQLQAQGYGDIEVSRTWLGRTRIEAESARREREIILNARTGEILRDYWVWRESDDDDDDLLDPDDLEEDGESSGSGGGNSGSGSENSGSGGDDDDDDEDDDDEDGGDDDEDDDDSSDDDDDDD